MRLPSSHRSEMHFRAPHWDGPFFRPLKCGEECDTRVKPPHILTLDAIGPEGAWIYPLSGFSYYESEGKRHKITPGTALVLHKPCQGKFYRTEEGLPFHYIWFTITGDQALGLFSFIHQRYGTIQKLPRNCEAIRGAFELLRLVEAQPLRSAHFWSAKTFAWINQWWECAERFNRPVISLRELLDRPSRRVPPTVGSIKNFARQTGYSRSYISHKLREQWKEPPGRVLRRRRLAEGARLLTASELSISEIAIKLGFSENSAFTRAFKQHYGMSPLQYRSAWKSARGQKV